MGPLSSQKDVCEQLKKNLRAADARIKNSGLQNCSFSYHVSDEGLVKISGCIHVIKASSLSESAVWTWIVDERISEEMDAGFAGQNGDSKQHPLLKSQDHICCL